MRINRRNIGDRDAGLSEEEICRRLRHEASIYLEAEDVLDRAAECIERLVEFRDSVLEQRMGLDLRIVQQGEEIERQKKIIDDYARICEASSREIRYLRDGKRPPKERVKK